MTGKEIRAHQRANRGSNPPVANLKSLIEGIDTWSQNQQAKGRRSHYGFLIGGYHWRDELSNKVETANIKYDNKQKSFTVSGAQCAGVSVWYTLNYSETFDSLEEALEYIDDIALGAIDELNILVDDEESE